MLRAVLFDLDNTLVDRDRAFRACVHARFNDAAVRAELFRLDQGGHGDRDTLYGFWARHTGTPMNQRTFGQMLAAHIEPDPELLRALGVISRQFKLGIVTNGSGETQRRKFLAAGLAKVIPEDHLWISEEVGVTKPAPAIFLMATRALGEPPEHCLFIGDREREDEAGAKAAGLRARLVTAVLTADRLNALIQEELQQC